MMKKLWFLAVWWVILFLFGIANVSLAMDRSPVFYVDFEDGNTTDIVGGQTAATGDAAIVSNGNGGYAAQFARQAGRSLYYGVSENVNDVLNNANSWGFTVAMRVMYTSLAPINNNSYEVLMARWKGWFNAQWFIGGRSGSRINIFTSSTWTATILDKSLTFNQPATGVWYDLIFSYDGTQYATYTNGVFVSSGLETLKPSTDSTLEFGRIVSETAATRGFDGYIDTVGIWAGVPTSEDITFIMDVLWTWEINIVLPENQNLENQTFITSDGLTIYYNVYYTTNQSGGIVITSDTWNAQTASYPSEMKGMRNNYGFIAATLATRGKGNSQGSANAFWYDCRDMYELALHLQTILSGYYDSAQWVHLMGASGGGGRALVCAGRYPDMFSSVYASASVSSLTKRYTIETNPQINSDRDAMRIRTWTGGLAYHPTGFPSVNGSIEDQEAYDARDAGLIGAYNTLSATYLIHGDNDSRVDISQDYAYDTIWRNRGKTGVDYVFIPLTGGGHSRLNYVEGTQWINTHKWTLTLPSSWDFRIGGRVETKKFKIEFLRDVGYMGTVNYQLKDNDQFKFILATTSYTGETEVLVKDVDENLDILDNGIVIGNLSGGVVSNVVLPYTITYNGITKELDIILQALNDTWNVIEGISPTVINPSNPNTPSWWGGGGGSSASKDNCPNGDFSSSYYDWICGTNPTTNDKVGTGLALSDKDPLTNEQPNDKQEDNASVVPTNNEILTAYQRAYNHNITTLAPMANATPDGTVIRQHLAKMVVNYALNALGWTLPEKVPAECHRKDGSNAWESQEMKDYAVKACSLGLMGIDMDYFQPYAQVSRAQFWTILSRLLYGTTYNGGKPYYMKHLQALKENGIMTQIDNPEGRMELRQRVRLMLMRSSKN